MDIVIYILGIFIIFCFILLWAISTYNRFQNFKIKINEAETNIDTILRKRFDLINKSIGIINNELKMEDEHITPIVDNLKSRKLTNYELDRELYAAINEFYLYKDSNEALKSVESFIKIDNNLNDSEIEITALRKYYNDIITEYNKLAKTFPFLIIAKLFGHKYRTYFDGKNMEDKNVNDFKL